MPALLWALFGCKPGEETAPALIAAAKPMDTPDPIPLAVLGDSDSHSYHDKILLGSGTTQQRGGKYHAVTLQWTEIISKLRPQFIDLGAWDTWGDGPVTRRLKKLIGRNHRGSIKQDYRYNFAISGAQCNQLIEGYRAQATALLELMNEAPQRWAGGIVVIRIGINNLGTRVQLNRFASTGFDATAQKDVQVCVEAVRKTLSVLRADHPATRFVVVGILDNADWPRLHQLWQDRRELENIASVLDAYDRGLRGLADADPLAVFLDDRAWFRGYWGSRDATGRPAYKTVSLGGAQSVSMTEGDLPTNAVIADGHAGTIWNGLWARDLARTLNQAFDLQIPDIRLEEISHLADPTGEIGLNGRRMRW